MCNNCITELEVDPKDPFGRHEVLDRVRILADMIEHMLVDNPFATAAELIIINSIAEDIEGLYQMVGSNNYDLNQHTNQK